jgi:hypothetical protein
MHTASLAPPLKDLKTNPKTNLLYAATSTAAAALHHSCKRLGWSRQQRLQQLLWRGRLVEKGDCLCKSANVPRLPATCRAGVGDVCRRVEC